MPGLNASQLQNIPPSATSGFTKDQLAMAVWRETCRAFTGDQIANITSIAFSGFQGQCADSWSEEVFKSISKDQVSNFSGTVCQRKSSISRHINLTTSLSELDLVKFGLLRPDAFGGFTSNCVADFVRCVDLNATFFGLLPPSAITGLTSICFEVTPNDIFRHASAEQIAALPLDVCSDIYAHYLPYIALDAVSGFTPACVAKMQMYDACGAMNGTWLAHLSLDSVTALTAHCIALVPAARDLNRLARDFFHALDPAACAGWSAAQSKFFSENAANGVTAECVGNFTSRGSNSACSGLTARFIHGLSATSFNGFTADCVQSIAAVAFIGVTREQLQSMDSTLCSVLSIDQIAATPVTAAPGMQTECLAQLSGNTCTGLQPDFVAKMPAETFNGFTVDCVQQLRSLAFSLISAAQVANLTVDAFNALANTQIDVITNTAIQGATLEQLSNVSESGFDGFTMAHFVIVIRKYGNALVSAWTIDQTSTAKVYEISRKYTNHFPNVVIIFNVILPRLQRLGVQAQLCQSDVLE